MANGIFGLRPSLGSYNISDGVVPAFYTRDTIGKHRTTQADVTNAKRLVMAFETWLCLLQGKVQAPLV